MWARWLAGTRGEADASKRRSGRKGEEGEEEEEESAMDYHRSKGSLPGGKRWWRRDARGCRCTAEPPVDATARKPLQRSTLAFASPLLLALSHLSFSLFLYSSLRAPLLFLLFFSRVPTNLRLLLSFSLSPSFSSPVSSLVLLPLHSHCTLGQ